jgi:hypothetical protein
MNRSSSERFTTEGTEVHGEEGPVDGRGAIGNSVAPFLAADSRCKRRRRRNGNAPPTVGFISVVSQHAFFSSGESPTSDRL